MWVLGVFPLKYSHDYTFFFGMTRYNTYDSTKYVQFDHHCLFTDLETT